MTTEAIKQFVQFFRQFLDLCLSPDWPDDDTEPEQIIRALEVAHHIEISVKKMKSETHCFYKFLDLLRTNQNFTQIFLQNCINDPPKFILKKVINSDAPLNLIDVSLNRFRDLYSEDRLVASLSELIVEAASKETLLENMSTMLPATKIQELKNQLHLLLILECNSQDMIEETLKDCGQDMMDVFVLCLVNGSMIALNKDDTELVRRRIITGFTNVMICRDISSKKFWENLFNVDNENLAEMCLKYKPLGETIFEALGDSYRQITNNLPPDTLYVQFTESQFHTKFKTIFQNEALKCEFIKYMRNNGYDEGCMAILQG